MAKLSLNFAAVSFLDRDGVLTELTQAVRDARRRYPEIVKVLLVGSLVRGDWTAASDADLVVVVRDQRADLGSRARYQIFTRAIPTDSQVFTETEFAAVGSDPQHPLASDLPDAVEL